MKIDKPDLEDGKLKMTIYLPGELVDSLDALKVQDQQERRVSRHMSRPQYVIWALEQYVQTRKNGRRQKT
jgi:hypothetical protein